MFLYIFIKTKSTNVRIIFYLIGGSMNDFEDYKEGNTQQRLEMYLQYPDLRSDFDNIENEEISTKTNLSRQIVIEPQKANIKQSLFVRVKNCCLSLFM